MAIFCLSVQLVKRSKGQSVLEASAYQTRDQLLFEGDDRRTKNYKDRGDLSDQPFILIPKNAPDWAKDRASLWNRVERFEKRQDAQLARSLVVALPHELTKEQRRSLLENFAFDAFVSKGMVADIAQHNPEKAGDGRNYHAHILLTMRKFVGDDFSKQKSREWNKPEQLLEWRELWARRCSLALHQAGFEKEGNDFVHAHLSLREQRLRALSAGNYGKAEDLDRYPKTHKGKTAIAMERRGIRPERDGKPYVEKNIVLMPKPARQEPDLSRYDILTVAKIQRQKKLAVEICSIWKSTTGAEDFITAIKARGYQLMRGSRDRLIIVDQNRNTYNLARLLKDNKTSASSVAADIQERLGHVKGSLPFAPFQSEIRRATREAMASSSRTRLLTTHRDKESDGFVRAAVQLSSRISPNMVEGGGSKDSDLLPIFMASNIAHYDGQLTNVMPSGTNILFGGANIATKKPTKNFRSAGSPKILMDANVHGRAGAAYDEVFSQFEARIRGVEKDRSLSPGQKAEAIRNLRQEQALSAKVARDRIIQDERSRVNAMRALKRGPRPQKYR